jgi:hypothetical protein
MAKTGKAAVLVALALAACSRPGALPSASPSPSPSAAAEADPGRPLPSPVPEVVARVNGQEVRIQQILPLAKARFELVPDAERERRRPEVVRGALRDYVDRELLLQEALARGLAADSRAVDFDYDQLRRDHPTEEAWSVFLAGQGMDPRSFRLELRTRHLVGALVEREAARRSVAPDEARAALLDELRARARVELLL